MTGPAVTPTTPGPTFSQAITNIASKTSIAAEPVAATPAVQIVRNSNSPTTPAPTAPTTPSLVPPNPRTASTEPPLAATPTTPATDSPPDVPAPSTDTAIPDAVAADAAGAQEAPDTPAPPTAELLGEILLDDGIKLTAERNADGTFKNKFDPKAKIDFSIVDKQTGETRTYSKTLPELARMAKDGIWGQKVRNEVEYYRKNVTAWEAKHQELSTNLEQQMALNRELLEAPEELVVARREEYAREQSPEKRLARLEAERAAEREQVTQTHAQQEVARHANTFIETRIAPVVKDAQAALGVEVVAGKMALGTQPYMVNGVIPPSNWAAVEAWVHGPFKQWVASETAKKAQSDAATKAARDAATEAQRRAQSAVNDAQRTSVPIGRAAPDTPAPLPKPKNTREAMDRLINRPLPATVGPPG